MVLAHCMLTVEMLFLGPEFFFAIRAERPFALKKGNCLLHRVFGIMCYVRLTPLLGTILWKMGKWLFK